MNEAFGSGLDRVSIHSRLNSREILPFGKARINQEKTAGKCEREKWERKSRAGWAILGNEEQQSHRLVVCANAPSFCHSFRFAHWQSTHTIRVSAKSTALNLPNSITFFSNGSMMR